jgi:hypothetical protein
MLIFLWHALIASKTKLFVIFTSVIRIEWIKTLFVDMDLFYKRIKKKKYPW